MWLQIQKARNRYVGITVFTAVFSLIYEYFSHGVHSGFMLWAALIPLICVVLPYTIWLRHQEDRERQKIQKQGMKLQDSRIQDADRRPEEICAPLSVYQTAILTFLAGSIFKGILEIYGTTNRLSAIYWIAGAILLAVSLGMLGWRLFLGRLEKGGQGS